MAKRVLAIGVGGSGKASLTILKERLLETYGIVPDNVVLLSLDTDSLRDVDQFAGARLAPAFDDRGRLPEFQHVVSPGGVTMNTVFADIRSAKTASYMNWLEHEKLDKMLSPAERDIRGGAQQRRPIGRTALFLRYTNPVYQSIIEAIGRMYGDPNEDQAEVQKAEDIEKGKRLIFIISSVAGGTGSGMLIDVANLVRHAVNTNQNWQSVSVSAVIVLPDAFATYTRFMDDPTNLKPNSYAGLRELDRFTRVHTNFLPYMVRYADGHQSITWSTNQPVDHLYLVDTASRSSSQDFDLSGDPMRGVFPVIADFVMAHVDNSLGDALATLRSNAGLHYDKALGRMYSSFNVMNYIFPVNDVIDSFSYRFIRELLTREFLPIADKTRQQTMGQEVIGEVEQRFSGSTVANQNNPNILQKSIVATRRIDPETPDMSWQGLFGMLSISDSTFAEHYQFLQQSLDYLSSNLVLSREGDYRKESFDEGATRLRNFTEQFLDDYLGPQIDPDNPDARFGGDWDSVLSQYRDSLRLRVAEVLDAYLLDVLNRRDERKMLLTARLPHAQLVVDTLKSYLVRFKKLLEDQWSKQDVDTRLRQVREELRNSITWMNETRYKRYLPPLVTEPRQAQESFKGNFLELMYLSLHQRVYQTVLNVLDSLGAAEKDRSGQVSVLDAAQSEMESWSLTLQDVDKIILERNRQHESRRNDKRTIKVRHYLTDAEFEKELYRHADHGPAVSLRIIGQVGDQKGLEWKRLTDRVPLDFKLVTSWGDQAKGAEEIADTWFKGTREQFQNVRKNVTIAERLNASFNSSHASFTNRCLMVEEPFLRFNPSENDSPMFRERYVSFNTDVVKEEAARQFLEKARATLRDQGFNVDTKAESVIACTVVEVSRGVKLAAVEPFKQCEPEYRAKLNQGREGVHLFPEEQNATKFEQSIPTLGETGNVQRALSSELVVALSDIAKLRAFILACAYGLVQEDSFYDPDTGQESTELWLHLNSDQRLPLSQSSVVRALETGFSNLPAESQSARLYLNAVQNYMLKITQPPGFDIGLVEQVKGVLIRRGVPLQGIENPFMLALKDVNEAVNQAALGLGPASSEIQDANAQRAGNAVRRLKHLQDFLNGQVKQFKASPDARIKDMGTVMHLILREEIDRLKRQAGPNA